jgi:hypothetical protein
VAGCQDVDEAHVGVVDVVLEGGVGIFEKLVVEVGFNRVLHGSDLFHRLGADKPARLDRR